MVQNKGYAYDTMCTDMYNLAHLLEKNLTEANQQAVLESIADKSSRFLDKDDKDIIYVHMKDEEVEKAKVTLDQ